MSLQSAPILLPAPRVAPHRARRRPRRSAAARSRGRGPLGADPGLPRSARAPARRGAHTASATTGPLPRSTRHRVAARRREAADPKGQLLRRQGAPRLHQALAARPRHRAEPEARRRPAQGLPGQPARRSGVELGNSDAKGGPKAALCVPGSRSFSTRGPWPRLKLGQEVQSLPARGRTPRARGSRARCRSGAARFRRRCRRPRSAGPCRRRSTLSRAPSR
jgi:hypothetical protein